MAGSKLADSEEILFTATQRGLAIRPGVDGKVDASTNALETFENYLASVSAIFSPVMTIWLLSPVLY